MINGATFAGDPATPRHFLDLSEIPVVDLRQILETALSIKRRRRKGEVAARRPLAGKVLAMIFDKPSTRTRVSFDVAMREMGGETIMLTGQEMQLGRGETIADTARVLSRFVDAIVIRVIDHGDLCELARHADVPVVNGLTKKSHPCQVMADVMTFEEHRGPIKGRTVAWSGDANNVLASWIHAAQRFDFVINVATPAELDLSPDLRAWAQNAGTRLNVTRDPYEAVRGADAVISDCWVSMGDENESFRHNLLAPYQVNSKLMAGCGEGCDLHALPSGAPRGRGHRRRDRRPTIRGLRRGRKPPACAEGYPRLVPRGARRMSDPPAQVMVRPVSDEARDDAILPFAVEPLDLRGRVVRLGASVDEILAQHAYPPPVARVVGEATALTALLGSALKFEGRLQLQTRSDGAIDMIVVDFDAPGRLRAFARFNEAKLAAADPGADLLGKGHLALTIEQGDDLARYQGVVALEGQGLEEAAHQYFRQSEQIPTFVRLAVAESMTGSQTAWRAGGLLVQFLPASRERQTRADLPPGDVPEGASVPEFFEDDAWVEAKALAATVEDHELVDPTLSGERLLYRLFHERGVKVFAAQSVKAACRCSRERIGAMLLRFTPQERADMIGDNGKIGVTCEFCSTYREFEPGEFDEG